MSRFNDAPATIRKHKPQPDKQLNDSKRDYHSMSKRKAKRKIILYITGFIMLGGTVVGAKATQFVHRSKDISGCPVNADKITHKQPLKLHPRKVVVQPWEGRHNVYGVFVIPKDHRSEWYVNIQLNDQETYCGSVVPVSKHWVETPLEPGQRVVIGLLRTRTAIWLLTNGKKSQLEQPANWTLATEKQS